MLSLYEFIRLWRDNMKQYKNRFNLNILSIFYLLILFVQIFGLIVEMFYEYIYQPTNPNMLIELFLIPKSFFNENCIGMSLFSVILIPLNNLYYSIKNSQNDELKENSRNYLEYIFCVIDVLLYCEIYNVEKVKENFENIKSNVLPFCITIIVVICVILLSKFLSKYIVAKKDRNDILDEIVSREEKQVNNENDNTDNKSDAKVELNNDLNEEHKEILKHPFSYAYENYKLYRARRKAIKYANKLEIKKLKEIELLQQAEKGEYYGDTSAAFVIISIVVFIIFVLVVYLIFKEGIGKNEGVVSEIFELINQLLKRLTNGLEMTEPNILNFFMVFGVIILGFISYILLVYTLTYIWKVWLYLAKKPNSENNYVKNLVESLEKLFSGTINEVVRLLLFIPDVLDKIIGIVYDGEQENDDFDEDENNGK